MDFIKKDDPQNPFNDLPMQQKLMAEYQTNNLDFEFALIFCLFGFLLWQSNIFIGWVVLLFGLLYLMYAAYNFIEYKKAAKEFCLNRLRGKRRKR